jgi:hypothetical protein
MSACQPKNMNYSEMSSFELQSELVELDDREGKPFCEHLNITSNITPHWLSSWSGKKLIEKIKKVFFETLRSLLFLSMIIPSITFIADVIKYRIEKATLSKTRDILVKEIVKKQREAQDVKIPSKTYFIYSAAKGSLAALISQIFISKINSYIPEVIAPYLSPCVFFVNVTLIATLIVEVVPTLYSLYCSSGKKVKLF